MVVFDTVCLLAKGQECVWDYNCSLKEDGYVLSRNEFLGSLVQGEHSEQCRSVAVPGRASARN